LPGKDLLVESPDADAVARLESSIETRPEEVLQGIVEALFARFHAFGGFDGQQPASFLGRGGHGEADESEAEDHGEQAGQWDGVVGTVGGGERKRDWLWERAGVEVAGSLGKSGLHGRTRRRF
jgi:hypothetical protein